MQSLALRYALCIRNERRMDDKHGHLSLAKMTIAGRNDDRNAQYPIPARIQICRG